MKVVISCFAGAKVGKLVFCNRDLCYRMPHYSPNDEPRAFHAYPAAYSYFCRNFHVMIKSMTGYGKATAEFGSKKINCEIRTLNSKGLDAMVKTSSLYREKEHEIRAVVSEKLLRGKVEVALYIETAEGEKQTEINIPLAQQYHRQLKELAEAIDSDSEDYLALVLRMPDVMTSEKAELTDEEWKVAQQVLQEAITHLNGFREQEGKHLEKDLVQRVETINSLCKRIEALAGERAEKVREKLVEALKQLSEREQPDPNRFEQELIYYLEKLDITEELVRLKGHTTYFVETLAEDAGQGKKLGFIAQEIGREINTIGSKANHAEIQRLVVQMKDELEKIKEQNLNIL